MQLNREQGDAIPRPASNSDGPCRTTDNSGYRVSSLWRRPSGTIRTKVARAPRAPLAAQSTAAIHRREGPESIRTTRRSRSINIPSLIRGAKDGQAPLARKLEEQGKMYEWVPLGKQKRLENKSGRSLRSRRVCHNLR